MHSLEKTKPMHLPLFKPVLLAGLCLLSTTAFAQLNLNKTKELLKDKKEQPSSRNNETKATGEKPTTAPPAPRQEDPKARHDAMGSKAPDKPAPAAKTYPDNSTTEMDLSAEPFPPSVDMASLLAEGYWYFNAATGEMKINRVQIGFLPQKLKDGSAADYTSWSSKGPLVRIEVVDLSTNTVNTTFHYSAQVATLPFYELVLKDVPADRYPSYAKLTEGSYALRFYVGMHHFHTHPFRVEKMSNSDPYAPLKALYFLRGAWDEWAYIDFSDDQNFVFNYYFTHRSMEVENQSRWDFSFQQRFFIKLFRDGKLIAVSKLNGEGEYDIDQFAVTNAKWELLSKALMIYPKNPKDFLTKADLKDGNYQVELEHSDEDGKNKQVLKYPFTVKNNTILPHEKADRSKTDPINLLEQGRDKHFIKKL
jgi:hypothetical protein